MNAIILYITNNKEIIIEALIQHIKLVVVATIVSIVLGLLIGIVSTYNEKLKSFCMMATQLMIVVPSLALMGILIPIFGIGYYNAITCLIIYSLLPIVKNTITGIEAVPNDITEAANGMGMKESRCLLFVKLPLALPIIIAGIRTSVVMLVGIATVVSQVGGGGLGRIVFRGVDQGNMAAIIVGAFLVSFLVIIIDKLFAVLQNRLEKKLLV